MNYKAETTLNEKDSLIDMLAIEKNLVTLYATAITEGCSKGFRTVVKNNLIKEIQDQINVFFLMTECGHAKVEAQDVAELNALREKFSKTKKELI